MKAPPLKIDAPEAFTFWAISMIWSWFSTEQGPAIIWKLPPPIFMPFTSMIESSVWNFLLAFLKGSLILFTDSIIEILNKQDRPIVYMLWGGPAQKKEKMLNNPKHLILKAPHPSPLSAYRGFFGCKHFSKANDFLCKNGIKPIDWQIENI